jgi:hypothetical protein
MPIVTVEQVLAIAPGYDDDFPSHSNTLPCPDKMAPVLEKMGYCCIEMYWQHAQTCYVFERDPWESQIVLRVGEFNNKFSDYCETGNTEPLAA